MLTVTHTDKTSLVAEQTSEEDEKCVCGPLVTSN